MKACTVFNDQDAVLLTRTHTASESGHHPLIRQLRHFWHEPELTFARFRIDEGINIEPLVERLNGTDQGVSRRYPDRFQGGLETDPVFVHGPQRNFGMVHLRQAEMRP